MDNHTEPQRHENMSHIRSVSSKEIIIRKYLFSKGYRYRKNDRRYAGCPDVVLPKYRTVIFVNGCFWHQHKGCKKATMPKSNHEYWEAKLKNNVSRDRKNMNELRSNGWKVIIIWECKLEKNKMKKTLAGLTREIEKNDLKRSVI